MERAGIFAAGHGRRVPATERVSRSAAAASFADNRPEVIAQRKLADAIDRSPQATAQRALIAGIHNRPMMTRDPFRTTRSDPVQRLLGGEGTKEEGEPIKSTIDKEEGSKHKFRTKHVANSAAEAIEKTQARIDLKSSFGRRTPNLCATEENWQKAVEASQSVVPPDGTWEKDNGNLEDQFETSLAKVSVSGWKVRDASRQDEDPTDLRAVEGSVDQSVGGNWSISGLDEEGEEVEGEATVTADIFHVDGK